MHARMTVSLCSCCSRTRSCVHALWSAAVQLLLKDTVVRACIVVCFCAVAAQGHGHACVHCGLLLCSCCSLLKDTVLHACIVVCFCAVAAHCSRHGRACMHCGLLLCSCCSLLMDTVMRACIVICFCAVAAKHTVVRACIVVCFTTYAACSIARKEGVKQALIWTCHKQLHRHYTHQSTESKPSMTLSTERHLLSVII